MKALFQSVAFALMVGQAFAANTGEFLAYDGVANSAVATNALRVTGVTNVAVKGGLTASTGTLTNFIAGVDSSLTGTNWVVDHTGKRFYTGVMTNDTQITVTNAPAAAIQTMMIDFETDGTDVLTFLGSDVKILGLNGGFATNVYTPPAGRWPIYISTSGGTNIVELGWLVYEKDAAQDVRLDDIESVQTGHDANIVDLLARNTTFALTIDDVADSMNYMLGFVPAGFTIQEIRAVHAGSGLSSPSILLTVYQGTDRTSGTAVVTGGSTITSSTTGNSVTTFDDETCPANSWLWITTGSKSGTTDNLEIIVRGVYD